MENMCDSLESAIPDESAVINVKYNIPQIENETVEESLRAIPFADIYKYVNDLGCEMLFCSSGVHLNGENKNPHAHFNFIVKYDKRPTNPSDHRKRWVKKNPDTSLEFFEASWKFHHKIDLSKPKYSTLAYPLKEGIEFNFNRKFFYFGLGETEINYLTEVGVAIYNKELALNLRRDKSEERQKKSLIDLAKICSDNKDKFSNYKSMLEWLEDNYLSMLPLEEIPDLNNYRKNCEKIGMFLNIFRYCDKII